MFPGVGCSILLSKAITLFCKVDRPVEMRTKLLMKPQRQPDGISIVAGDFNQTDLRSVLPKFHQHVHTPTRGSNTLDHVYTNISGSYKALPIPQFGQSDHICFSCLLTHNWLKESKHQKKTICVNRWLLQLYRTVCSAQSGTEGQMWNKLLSSRKTCHKTIVTKRSSTTNLFHHVKQNPVQNEECIKLFQNSNVHEPQDASRGILIWVCINSIMQ